MAFSGAAAATAAAASAGDASAQAELPRTPETLDDWESVRRQFPPPDGMIHMSAMLIASHPTPVRDAIEEHRRRLDANPVEYLENNNARLTQAVRSAAGDYLGVHNSHIALTDSTTSGVGLIYNGLKLRPGDDIVTTEEDYYVTHESLRLAAEKSGATVRKVKLFDAIETITESEIVDRIVGALQPATRLVALTWVHSSTGLKIPVAAIAGALRDANRNRAEEDQILLGIDGVHGFGVEDAGFEELGCDFLMAGCHKWLFGPRGTGIVAISKRGLDAVRPTIPTFNDNSVFAAWIQEDTASPADNSGRRMTPGGFKPFEHLWALTEAFDFHERIGKPRVAARTGELAGALKEELSGIPGVSVQTPRDPRLSAGIVAFDVDSVAPEGTVSRLRERRIIASVAPYATPHARLTPSIRNSEAEIDEVAAALREIA